MWTFRIIQIQKSAVRQAHIPFLSLSWVLHWGIPKSNADPEKGTKTGCRQRLSWPQKVPSSVLVLVRNMIDIFWHDYTSKGCSFGCQQNWIKETLSVLQQQIMVRRYQSHTKALIWPPVWVWQTFDAWKNRFWVFTWIAGKSFGCLKKTCY